MTNKRLYIDDIRNPKTDNEWIVLRTSEEAINFVKKNGIPHEVSLDHDLGGDDTIMIFLKWLVEYDMDNDGKIIPLDFKWIVHSANPVGTKNIDGLLIGYMDFKAKSKEIFFC